MGALLSGTLSAVKLQTRSSGLKRTRRFCRSVKVSVLCTVLLAAMSPSTTWLSTMTVWGELLLTVAVTLVSASAGLLTEIV